MTDYPIIPHRWPKLSWPYLGVVLEDSKPETDFSVWPGSTPPSVRRPHHFYIDRNVMFRVSLWVIFGEKKNFEKFFEKNKSEGWSDKD